MLSVLEANTTTDTLDYFFLKVKKQMLHDSCRVVRTT